MLSRDEADSILVAAKEAAAPEKFLIAGTGAESTSETIARTKRAAVIGYPVALVKTPYYYKPVYRGEHYLRHYRAVADASPIPILLYSVPQFTGITLETPEILALAAHPNIAGIKDSSGDVGKLIRMVSEVKPGFPVLTGNAATLAPALAAGASGAILALANAAPYACISIWEANRTREAGAAMDWQRRIEKPSRISSVKHGIPGLKHAMDLMGYYGGPPRLPFVAPSPQAKLEIEEAFADLRG